MNIFNWPLMVTAILLGMGLGIQAPINAWIGKRLGSPYWGAGFSISTRPACGGASGNTFAPTRFFTAMPWRMIGPRSRNYTTSRRIWESATISQGSIPRFSPSYVR